MTQQASTPGAGFFYRQPTGSGSVGAPAPSPGGSGQRFTGKQLLLAFLCGGFTVGYFTWDGQYETKPTKAPTHFAHPVRVKGTAVDVLTEPRAEASAIASVSNADSVENIGRLNDQWSQVRLHDGREGFVSNEFLEGVPYVPLAAAAVAATALAPAYSGRAGRRERTLRRENRRLRRHLSRRPASAYIAPPAEAPSHATRPAPTYSTTYSTAGSSANSYRSSGNRFSSTRQQLRLPRSSYRSSSGSSGSTPSYRPTYSAPKVNYTFRSRSLKPRK